MKTVDITQVEKQARAKTFGRSDTIATEINPTFSPARACFSTSSAVSTRTSGGDPLDAILSRPPHAFGDQIVGEFGGVVPTSILRYNSSDRAIDVIVETERSYENTADDGGHAGKLGRAFSVGGRTCRGKGAGLSRFPQNVGRALLLLYTNKGDTVLDPFAGHNSRMELCWRAGRNYKGNDISQYFQDANRRVLNWLMIEKDRDLFRDIGADVDLSVGDSRHLPWESGSGDFTITSPPYYNLEFYGDEPKQLGLGAVSYVDFLNRLFEVMSENFRVLKAGRFCIWCVNDFRLDGQFYNYHSDVIALMRKAGFVQHDICIIDLVSSIAAAFVNQIVERKLLPKRHEYALIFQKPR
jgi:DNA modification methylase